MRHKSVLLIHPSGNVNKNQPYDYVSYDEKPYARKRLLHCRDKRLKHCKTAKHAFKEAKCGFPGDEHERKASQPWQKRHPAERGKRVRDIPVVDEQHDNAEHEKDKRGKRELRKEVGNGFKRLGKQKNSERDNRGKGREVEQARNPSHYETCKAKPVCFCHAPAETTKYI
jgi:hypothetical protein